MPAITSAEIARVFRAEYGRAVAVLVRAVGDIDLAEEAVQDAFTAAVQRWPSAGLPPSPAGWIITTARNRAIDRLRREASRADRHAQAALLHAREEPAEEEGPVRDDRLRLIFRSRRPSTPSTVMHRPPPPPTGRRSGSLYDQLLTVAPSPVVALHRAVAVAEVDGPEAGLSLVDGLDLDRYHLFHAIRADLLRRLGRDAEAVQAYEAAIARTDNAAERAFLQRRRRALSVSPHRSYPMPPA